MRSKAYFIRNTKKNCKFCLRSAELRDFYERPKYGHTERTEMDSGWRSECCPQQQLTEARSIGETA